MNIDYQNGILLPSFFRTMDENQSVFAGEFSNNFFLLVTLDKNQLIYPVWKTHRNLFPAGITLGRGLVNDICIPSEAISKIHAYFRQVNNEWIIIDHYSIRGTWIENYKVSAAQNNVVADQAKLKFGSLEASFLSFASLLKLKDRTECLPVSIGPEYSRAWLAAQK